MFYYEILQTHKFMETKITKTSVFNTSAWYNFDQLMSSVFMTTQGLNKTWEWHLSPWSPCGMAWDNADAMDYCTEKIVRISLGLSYSCSNYEGTEQVKSQQKTQMPLDPAQRKGKTSTWILSENQNLLLNTLQWAQKVTSGSWISQDT